MEKRGAVFVRIDDYKDVTDILALAREKLEQAKGILAKLEHIKAEEDAELGSWATDLADVEHRLEEIDNKLSQPES